MENLKHYDVQELNNQEIQGTTGGWLIPVLMLLGAMINDAQNNPDDFAAGANDFCHTC